MITGRKQTESLLTTSLILRLFVGLAAPGTIFIAEGSHPAFCSCVSTDSSGEQTPSLFSTLKTLTRLKAPGRLV